jgi:hypothetical protein
MTCSLPSPFALLSTPQDPFCIATCLPDLAVPNAVAQQLVRSNARAPQMVNASAPCAIISKSDEAAPADQLTAKPRRLSARQLQALHHQNLPQLL